MIHYALLYDQLIIEVDCLLLLSILRDKDALTGNLTDEARRAGLFLSLNGATLQYTPREVNFTARKLSQHSLTANGLRVFTNLASMVPKVRGGILTIDACHTFSYSTCVLYVCGLATTDGHREPI